MADLTREKVAETNRVMQVHKDKALEQLTAQINEAFKIEDDRLARGAAAVEDEYQIKNKEKEAKQKAAIESIAEHRTAVVRNLACSYSFFCHTLVLLNTFWKQYGF